VPVWSIVIVPIVTYKRSTLANSEK
jgi:hypothetical protein